MGVFYHVQGQIKFDLYIVDQIKRLTLLENKSRNSVFQISVKINKGVRLAGVVKG